MTVRVRIRGGREITGVTLTDAIRAAYGPTAQFRPNGDPNSPEAGSIISPAEFGDRGVFHLHAAVLEIEEEA